MQQLDSIVIVVSSWCDDAVLLVVLADEGAGVVHLLVVLADEGAGVVHLLDDVAASSSEEDEQSPGDFKDFDMS